MYEAHFGLRENPFVAGHQSKFVYPSREHQEALAHLRYGIENREPFVLITGEVGTGKTTALYDALHEWQGRAVVALITNSALTRAELIEEIALRFGMPLSGAISKPQAMVQLERHLLSVRARGERAILLLDEAQNLDRALLEEIRLLSNLEVQGEKLIQIFLVGQPELEERLARAELRQLRQRIAVHYRLHPLSAEDTERYVHHRLSIAGGYAPSLFPAESCRELYRLTHGIPREINTLAGQALLNAFVEGERSVRPEHVRAAAQETEFRSVLTESGGSRAPASEHEIEEAGMREPTGVAPAADPASWDAWLRSLPGTPDAADEQGPEPEAVDELLDVEFEEEAAEPPHVEPARPAPVAPPPPPRPVAAPPVVPVPQAPVASAWTPAPVRSPEPAWTHAPAPSPMPEPARPFVTPRPEPTPPVYLPPRLRDKLARAEEEGSGPSAAALRGMIGIAVLALVIVTGVLAYRFTLWPPLNRSVDAVLGRSAPARPSAPAANPTDSTANAPASTTTNEPATHPPVTNPEPARSTPSAAASVPAPAVVKPATRPARPAAIPARSTSTSPAPARPSGSGAGTTTTPAAAPATAEPRTLYGLSVGTFLFEDIAAAERTKLATSTGLAGRVQTVREGSETLYRLVLGSFDTRTVAERTASDLIARGLVDEARVVVVGREAP